MARDMEWAIGSLPGRGCPKGLRADADGNSGKREKLPAICSSRGRMRRRLRAARRQGCAVGGDRENQTSGWADFRVRSSGIIPNPSTSGTTPAKVIRTRSLRFKRAEALARTHPVRKCVTGLKVVLLILANCRYPMFQTGAAEQSFTVAKAGMSGRSLFRARC